MRYLSKAYIILLNRKTIKAHGGQYIGPYNFLHESPLDYLLDAVQAQMFGEEIYPTVHEKAGLYLFSIIANHILQDGNKRTGLAASLLFLAHNGYRLKQDLSHDELYNFVIRVASGELSLKETQEWFRVNIIPY